MTVPTTDRIIKIRDVNYLSSSGGTSRSSRTALSSPTRKCVAHSWNAQSEAAPVGRNSVIAMQFGFLRAIAPVEILVGTERRRPPEFVVIDVELVRLEAR